MKTSIEKKYTTTIGLEIHAELKTFTKMFCDSKNDPHNGEPNTNVCPICMGHPGTLPTINEEAVKSVLKVGTALGAEIATYTEFDRKNYFYPDIPKGYQISQYLYPLVKGGSLSGVAVTRVHLEEDTARSLHDQGEGSIIDFNRAGVPLMELVTEPVIHDAKTAGDFARELQLLLRTLGVSDANMEKGEMRVEANISVSATDTYGTKVEVKNINSFKSVEGAIRYEVKRQIQLLEEGGKVIQETRGWDEAKGKTFSQRIKESANDYRYFPDPDLPKLDISKSDTLSLSRIKEDMPVLPDEKRIKYGDIGLAREQIEIIIGNNSIDSFFKKVCALSPDNDAVKLSANYIVTDIVSISENGRELEDTQPEPFLKLMSMIIGGKLNSRVAKDILPHVIFKNIDPEEHAREHGLLQDSSTDGIQAIVDQVIVGNPNVVADVRSGKEAALQFLVGQGMRISRGSANPAMLIELFKKTIAG